MTNYQPENGPTGAANPLLDEAIGWCLRMNGEDADQHRAGFEAWLALGGVHREIYSQVSELYGFGEQLRDIEVARPPIKLHATSANTTSLPNRTTQRRSRAALVAATAFAILVSGWQSLRVLWPHGSAVSAPLQSLVGEIRTLRLDDGSSLILDTDSVVETAFSGSERRLRLARGRARFDVAPEKRPFIVEAHGAVILVGGTLFDVSLGDRDAVDIILLRGAAEISASGSQPMLRPAIFTRMTQGTVAQFRPGRPVAFTRLSGNAPPAVMWPNALAAFEGAPLAEVVRQANRYARVKLVLENPRLGQRRFWGTVHLNDTNQLAQLLAHALSLQVTIERDSILLSGR